MGKKQTLQRQMLEQKQQLLLQQQMLVDAVKLSPNVYCAYLLAQQREFITSLCCPFLCAYLWDSKTVSCT